VAEFRYHDINRLSPEDALKRLETGRGGLTAEEALRRLSEFEPNMLIEPDRYSLLRGLVRQFTHFLAVLLWIAAGLAFAAHFLQPGEGMATLGWAILGVIMINAGFAFLQEYKAEHAVQALRRLLPDRAWVTRGGQSIDISRTEIVPGAGAGRRTPCRGRRNAGGQRLVDRRVEAEATDGRSRGGWTLA
jgi:sodium/potassium-transporting ATPase subunit alpha